MSFDIKYDKEGQPLPMSQQSPLPETHSPEPTRDESSHVELEQSVRDEMSHTIEDNVEVANEQSEDQPKETFSQRNLRAMREAKEEAERERDRALRRIKEYEDAIREKKPSREYNDSEQEDLGIGDDDLTEGRHYKKMYNEFQNLKRELDQYKKSSHTQSIETRIRAEFPDFEKVVTPENLAILKRIKPRQSALIDQSNDLYTAASNAYDMIKEYGIYEAERDDYMKNKNLAQKNLSKPKTVTSLAPNKGESPLHRANLFAEGLTPQLAAQLHKEMMESTKGR